MESHQDFTADEQVLEALLREAEEGSKELEAMLASAVDDSALVLATLDTSEQGAQPPVSQSEAVSVKRLGK